MTTKAPRAFSDLPISPGEVLEEELEARGMTQKELAARLGRPAQAINEIIKAKKAITPDTAIMLEKALGIDAQFWANLETDYRMTLARNREREWLDANEKWLSYYPVREMIKRGWMEAGRDRQSKSRALLNFLGVADAEPRVYQEAVGFRITEAAQSSVSIGALTAWLRKGELDAQEISTAPYDRGAFRVALTKIRGMTGDSPENFVPAMEALCAEAGVAFCIVQEFPKSGANGATRWLNDRKALVQMSIRGKWADIFWFTFFHEACHLLNHRTRRRFVIEGLDVDPEMTELEAEADEFARDFLIAPDRWANFCARGRFNSKSVQALARSIDIAPFMVVGRLQKEGRVGYNQLSALKRRYEWAAG